MPKVERAYYPGQNVRIFHHYEKLEEFHAGLWSIRRGSIRRGFIDAAADLMRQADDFQEAMKQVISEWPVSCEHNLTALATNRIAWLGHAGCCIATGSPEECTRAGWHTLSREEQDAANKAAEEVISEWDKTTLGLQQNDLFSGVSNA